MNGDPQIGTSRANSLQIPSVLMEETVDLSPTLMSAIDDLSIGNSEDEEDFDEGGSVQVVDENEMDTSESGASNSRNRYERPYLTASHNNGFGNSTTTLSQPVAPVERDAIVVNQPTAAMITNFRLGKTREQMSREELVNFVINPVPQGQKVLCKITRSKDGFGKLYPQYELYIEETLENGEEITTFLLSARKRKKSKSSHYVITTDRLDVPASVKNIVGKVRSNFLGTAFVIYSNGKNPFKREPELEDFPIREELGAVVYDPNILGFKGPRKMTVLLIGMTRSGQRPEFRPTKDSQTLIGRFRNGDHRDILVLHNKSPQWNEETQSYVLNFNGRVTLASVKNFQIVHDNDLDYIIMQFGRIEEDTFNMDFMYPMCPLQAFAIALTSFDAKLACE
ncbi:10540_t:CDS:2 [Acaulospora morrowiae]|uniref:10540_t:CDS:1 n=1 Tax=Acaulospora morrowiae TaxID=94023 RepID=A0A9N8VL17_9GLOM|nr:10540_t:CDS:2 [Acaulospora morrowiae]